jgi:hypothetical protein
VKISGVKRKDFPFPGAKEKEQFQDLQFGGQFFAM